jgi:glycosyltransferase involved in cell wall biosynthesis
MAAKTQSPAPMLQANILPSISTVTRSPGLPVDAVETIVIVPTFRRPAQILETLASLQRQETARRFAVILIENEAEKREGAIAATSLFESGAIAGMIIVAHERGNCCAYNAGLETALATFPNFKWLAIIDDDEIADAKWLERLCAAGEMFGADLVGGPQLPVFPDNSGKRFTSHPVFAPHYRQSGLVDALYSSGNLMMRRHVLVAMGAPFLDLRFNFMGGGDSDFLSRTAAKGFKLAWCADAVVHETVPARRLEADWIRSRSLRNGVISMLVEKKKRAASPVGNLRVLAKSLALLAASPFRGLVRLLQTGSLSSAMYPAYIAIGRILAEFGYSNEQYRQPEKN